MSTRRVIIEVWLEVDESVLTDNGEQAMHLGVEDLRQGVEDAVVYAMKNDNSKYLTGTVLLLTKAK